MQDYDSLQMETQGIFQTANVQYSNSNYNLLPPNDLAIQGIGNGNLADYGVAYSSEGVLNNAGASNILQPIEDEMFFDDIFAEVQFLIQNLRQL